MFSSKEFIELSRNFVCLRIDPYESKEHQELVRKFLNGRFANTAFCILSPDGKQRLTRSGRSPNSIFGEGDSTMEMAAIARKHPAKFNQLQAVVQDFHSVDQGLNVASADQRLLVLVTGPKEKIEKTREVIKPVINHKHMIGRFHVDFETSNGWSKTVANEKSNEGIMFVAAGEFGLSGKVLRQLPLDATQEDIRDELIRSNKMFAATTKKKEYAAHISKGHRTGIRYESFIPYGEDRDGDGKIDQKKGRRQGPRN